MEDFTVGPRRGNREGTPVLEPASEKRKYSRWTWKTLVTGYGRVTTPGRKGESKTAVKRRHDAKVAAVADVKRPGRGTLAEWVDVWLRLYVRDKAPRTRDYYRSMTDLLLPHLGDKPLGGITSDELLVALDKLTRPSNRRKAYEVLRICLNRAAKVGRVRENVCLTVDPPSSETATVDDGLRGHRDEALIVTALATGLRQGELVGLRWMDLEVSDGRRTAYQAETVHRGRDGGGGSVHVGKPGADGGVLSAVIYVRGQLDRNRQYVRPKRSSVRTVPLPPSAVASIEAHRQRVTLASGKHPEPADYIFADAHGRPMTGWEAYRRWQVACRQAGTPEFSFHAIRHWYASVQSPEQRDLVARLMGHKDTKMTAHYTHLTADDWQRATRRVDEALGG
jgi:integrase